jgi:hypothetical protein
LLKSDNLLKSGCIRRTKRQNSLGSHSRHARNFCEFLSIPQYFSAFDKLPLIGQYDAKHYPPGDVPPAAVLRFLLDQHQLKQTDLPEIGSQGVVSEILNGKRDLNTRQIKELSKRFGVSPAVFL